ncbi:MAG: hypothetical protein ACE367_06040 [Acidimicrobiales bacterium]
MGRQDPRAPEVAVVWSESWGDGAVDRRRARRWLLPLAALMTVLVVAQAPSAHGPPREEFAVLPGIATAPTAPTAPSGRMAPPGPGPGSVDAASAAVGGACVTVPSAIPNVDLAADPWGRIWTGADALAAAAGIGPNVELPRDPVGLRSSGADPACGA